MSKDSQKGYDIKSFDSIEKFQEYYKNNQEEIDNQSTVALNLRYKIKDYVIRKSHGSIGFKRVGTCVKMNPLNKRLTVVEELLNQVIEKVNEMIGTDVLQQSCEGSKINNISIDYD